MNPIHYDSDDIGAPQIIANDPASFLNVLYTCLVGTAGVAYGDKAPAGWTCPYRDVPLNKMVLRQGSGNMRYLRFGEPEVISQGHAYDGRRFIQVRLYEEMAGIDSGTNPSPSITSRPLNSYYWAWATGNSSGNTSLSIIPWSIIACDRFFYIVLFAAQASPNGSTTTYFVGDIKSNKPGDIFNTIIYANSERNTNSYDNWYASSGGNTSDYNYKPFVNHVIGAVQPNLFIARPYTQVGQSKEVGLHSFSTRTGNGFGNGPFPFPDKISGSVEMSPVWVHENSGGILVRGQLPGIWVPFSSRSFEHLDIIPGTDEFLGTDFISWRQRSETRYSRVDNYNVLFQLSDWYA